MDEFRDTPPYIVVPNGRMEQPGGSANKNNKIQETQAKVDEVVGIMRVNVEKVMERDQKLSDLHDRADALQHGASQFEQQAYRLKRNMWLKNMKMWLVIGGICGVLLLIIIIWVSASTGES